MIFTHSENHIMIVLITNLRQPSWIHDVITLFNLTPILSAHIATSGET